MRNIHADSSEQAKLLLKNLTGSTSSEKEMCSEMRKNFYFVLFAKYTAYLSDNADADLMSFRCFLNFVEEYLISPYTEPFKIQRREERQILKDTQYQNDVRSNYSPYEPKVRAPTPRRAEKDVFFSLHALVIVMRDWYESYGMDLMELKDGYRIMEIQIYKLI